MNKERYTNNIMHPGKSQSMRKEEQRHPYEEANFLSLIFFLWPYQLIKDGSTKTLNFEDLPVIVREDESKSLNALVTNEWQKEVVKSSPSLLRALWRAFYPKYGWLGIILVGESIIRIFQAMLLGYFVDIIVTGGSSSIALLNNGYVVSTLLTCSGIVIGVAHHQYFFYGWRMGMQLRIAVTSMIYDKAVVLHMRSLSHTSSSHIVNLSSQDVEAFQQGGVFFHFLYAPLLEAIGILIVGVMTLGWSFLAGFGAVVLLVPLQMFFSRSLTDLRSDLGKSTDRRIKLVSQALSGVRLMKINGWEWAFDELIGIARKQEMSMLQRINNVKGFNEAIFFVAPAVVGAATFITYSQTGGTLSPAKVFTVLTFFGIVQFNLVKFFPLAGGNTITALYELGTNHIIAVQFMAQSYVAISRTESLLLLEECTKSEAIMHANCSMPTREYNEDRTSGDQGTELVPLQGIAADENTISILDNMKKNNIALRMQNFSATWQSESTPMSDLPSSASLVLEDINLSVVTGELIVIVGPVGASKSSVLMAMLGELAPLTNGKGGRLDKIGSYAYCSQEPWIMSSTVKENILFGREYDEAWYLAVLKHCDLLSDLKLLSAGDQTVIGDRGINLSGGQRARVGLARAVYSDADIFLFDDPLSAVDPKVGNILFNKAVCDALVGKTRILVTHQLQFLSSPAVSRIIVLDNGKIRSIGSYVELKESGELDWMHDSDKGSDAGEEDCADMGSIPELLDFSMGGSAGRGGKGALLTNFSSHHLDSDSTSASRTTMSRLQDLHAHEKVHGEHVSTIELQVGDMHTEEEEGHRAAEGGEVDGLIDHQVNYFNSSTAGISVTSSRDYRPVPNEEYAREADGTAEVGEDEGEVTYEKDKKEDPNVGGITVAEDRTEGQVSSATYLSYLKSMGGLAVSALLLLVMTLGQVLVILSTVWLAYWAKQSSDAQERMSNIYVYAGIVAACVVVSILRSVFSFKLTGDAATSLHNSMMKSVLRATILFFDSNPFGRVLNRFSKDQHFIDDVLPFVMYDFVQCTLMVLAAIVVVIVGSPIIAVCLVPLVPYFLALRRYFLRTSREVKRLDALCRSPVFSLISETLDGLTTIRAYNRLQSFQDRHKVLIDAHTRADFAFMASSRWLGFRLDVSVVALLAASTFGATIAKQFRFGGSPEALAAGLMYVMQLAGLFQWCIRQSAELENMMVSVERVVEYGHLDSENVLHGPRDISNRPEWPEKGHIEIKDLKCYYREGAPLVLRGVSVQISPGERVGVVGRTGAGKSTLISVLLRLIEYQHGTIEIDGIDIKSIGLHDLRPKISVIPQVPFLFSGTIRENMDIFQKYTDDEIWSALDCVSLKSVVNRVAGGNGLSGVVAENGSNFSVGERQLLCLARAILQRNRILIMDEATANVDLETDEKVQVAIKREFRQSTVIMVAHRILTVIDCDKVLVMAEGLLEEADHPHILLSNYFGDCLKDKAALNIPDDATLKSLGIPKKSFASMVFETGPIMCKQLRMYAAAAWVAKHKT